MDLRFRGGGNRPPPLPPSPVDQLAERVHNSLTNVKGALSTLSGNMWALAAIATIFIILSYFFILSTFVFAQGLSGEMDDLKGVVGNITDTCCGEPIDEDELCTVLGTTDYSCIGESLCSGLSTTNYSCIGESLCSGLSDADLACLGDVNGTNQDNHTVLLYLNETNEHIYIDPEDICPESCKDGIVEECEKAFGSLAWFDGNITQDNRLTVTIDTEDVWVPISDSLCQVIEFQNMTYLGNCTWMIDINDTYTVDASMGFVSSMNMDPEIALGISIDGAIPQDEHYESSSFGQIGFQTILNLTEGQMISLSVLNTDNTEDVLIRSMHLTIVDTLICVDTALPTDFQVTSLQFPQGDGSPPCSCNNGTECPPNLMWFSAIDGAFYFCDGDSDSWLQVGPPISMAGEMDVGCNFGNDLTNDNGCSVAWGAGVGTDDNTPRNGLFMYTDFTIISWGISIDEQSECSSGSYDAMVCWSSGPTQDSDFALANCTDFATNLTSDAENALDIRVDVPGNRYVSWGIRNNCNGGGTITDWNIHMLIKYRISNP